MEEWRDIPNYEGWYQISNYGNIKAISGRIRSDRKIWKNGRGYPCINITNGQETRKYLVHRLVALTFLDNPNNLPQVNHIDGNKNNSSLINLEWCSSLHNNLHAIRTGLRKRKIK